MRKDPVIIRVSATDSPVVQIGQKLRRGQRLSNDEMAPLSPLSGVVQSIRFDGPRHEFAIVIAPTDGLGGEFAGS